MKPLPTLKSIANELEISANTVSRALRNDPKISEATRKRVRNVAKRVGYRSNAFAASLVHHRISKGNRRFKAILGLLVGHPEKNPLKHLSDYQRVLAGAKNRAEKQGYQIEPHWAYQPGIKPRRLHQILQSKGVPGLILLGMNPLEIKLPFGHYACSMAAPSGFEIKSSLFSFATIDPYDLVQLAADRLVKQGRKRIGLALAHHFELNASGRYYASLNAFHRSCCQLPKICPIPLFVWDEKHPLPTRQFKAWIRRYRPDVVLTINTSSRLKAQLEPPDRRAISFVDLDLEPDNKSFAGTVRPHEEIGAAAVDLVIGALYRNERGFPGSLKGVFLQASWRSKDSLKQSL
ncbi:MAG: LacI family DNA-binding transcriptional regulator [Verrucomicrobiota bacterium]